MTSPTSKGTFRNVIVCEDIRDEAGNKKSLMGVMPGDILVQSFPATIRVAFYIEYEPDPAEGDALSVELWLSQDETNVARGKFEAAATEGKSANLVFPAGLILFEKAAILRVVVAVNGGPSREIISKKVQLATL